MKLWLLRPWCYPNEAGKWDPWYNKAFGFVVQAQNEQEARQLAALEAGAERAEAWLSSGHSTCQELLADGPAHVVMRDLWSA